jgi:hypothetical protein
MYQVATFYDAGDTSADQQFNNWAEKHTYFLIISVQKFIWDGDKEALTVFFKEEDV